MYNLHIYINKYIFIIFIYINNYICIIIIYICIKYDIKILSKGKKLRKKIKNEKKKKKKKKNLNYPIKLYKVVDNKKNVIKMKI